MKKLMMTCLLTTLMGQSVQALAGREGGGGGGICIGNKCITLAEAGIRITETAPVSSQWHMSLAVLNHIKQISKTLPFGGEDILKKAIGKTDTFSIPETVSPKLLRQITKEYQEVLREANNEAIAKDLKIFAISNSTETFLLPSFFDLNDYQKALVLVHEGIVRDVRQDYRLALQFDGEYLDYLKREESHEYSPLKFYKVLSRVINDEHAQTESILEYVESKLGRKLTIVDFFDNDALDMNKKMKEIAPIALLENEAIVPGYINLFSEVSVMHLGYFNNRIEDYTNAAIRFKFSTEQLNEACKGIEIGKTVRLKQSSHSYPAIFYTCRGYNSELYAKGTELVFSGLNWDLPKKK